MAKKSVQLSGVVVAESAICSIDPDEGVLMHRGYDIADLAEQSTYEETFLAMLHGERPNEREARAFEVAMILHAEHELNASTFAARVVAGTGADLTGAVVAAIAALSGPLHGGANEAAMGMFERWGS